MSSKTVALLTLTATLGMAAHVHAAPTSVSINQTVAAAKVTSTQPIMAYFGSANEDYAYSNTPVKGGFYRVFLGRDAKGRFLVQDLFTDNNKKQTDPYWLTSAEGLGDFGLDYVDSLIQGYYSNGKTAFKGNIKQGDYVGKYDSFYPTGELANSYTPLGAEHYKDEYFYKNGKKAATLEYNDEGETTKQEAWGQDGKKITGDAIDEIVNEINEQLALDQ